MSNQNTAVSQSAQHTPAPKKGVDILKSVLNAPSIQEQFRNAMGENSSGFIASIIDLYNSDTALQQCAPQKVVMEALKAAVLKLPINKSLGFAYVIGYNNSVKLSDGSWEKEMIPTFQLGYRGYVQLAMRTGQYRTINADVAYEGEVRTVNKLTGEIAFDGVKKSDKVVGYFCYFELLNGFSKTLYMTVEQMAKHAKKNGKGVPATTTIEKLISLANIESTIKGVGWLGNFNAMALKTVIRLLLSKYGFLSIEMQSAISSDEEPDRDTQVQAMGNKTELNVQDVHYEDVSPAQPAEQKESIQTKAPF